MFRQVPDAVEEGAIQARESSTHPRWYHWQEQRDSRLTRPQICPTNGVHLRGTVSVTTQRQDKQWREHIEEHSPWVVPVIRGKGMSGLRGRQAAGSGGLWRTFDGRGTGRCPVLLWGVSGRHRPQAGGIGTLMARFYLDKDVSPRVGRLLAQHGHDSVHTYELGNRRTSDPEHLLVVANAGRVLVTFNRGESGPLHQFWTALNIWGTLSQSHAGILSSWGQIPAIEWAGLIHSSVSPEPALDNQMREWQRQQRSWRLFGW